MSRYIDVAFLAGVQVGKEIYFSAWNINGLFKMNPKTGECIFLKKFSEKVEHLHMDAVLYGDFIWFIPGQADQFAKVNIHTLEIVYIPLPDRGRKIDIKPQVRFSIWQNGNEPYLWLTPQGYNQLLRVNMDTDEIQVCWEWEDSKIRFSNSLMKDGVLWLCPYDDLEGVCYDTQSGKMSLYPFEEKEREYINIKCFKDWVIFFPRNLSEPIVKMNCHTYQKEYVYTHLENQHCYAVSMRGSKACLIPYTGKTYCIVDFETDDICIIDDPWEKRFGYASDMLSYYKVIEYDDIALYLPLMRGIPSLSYDWKRENFRFLRFYIDLTDYASKDADTLREMCYRSWLSGNDQTVMTDQQFGVEELIEILDYIQTDNKKNQEKSNIGEQIWGAIRDR